MACGCKETDHGYDCPFQDTYVLEGQFFPKKQLYDLLLTTTAGQKVRKVNILTDVMVTMYVTVINGVLDCWDMDLASNPSVETGGERPHMRFVADAPPVEIVLPPGEHRFVFGAANSAACQAAVYVVDREAHK